MVTSQRLLLEFKSTRTKRLPSRLCHLRRTWQLGIFVFPPSQRATVHTGLGLSRSRWGDCAGESHRPDTEPPPRTGRPRPRPARPCPRRQEFPPGMDIAQNTGVWPGDPVGFDGEVVWIRRPRVVCHQCVSTLPLQPSSLFWVAFRTRARGEARIPSMLWMIMIKI